MATEREKVLSDLIRVLIVDDHAILRDGIRTLLERQPDIEVIGEAANGREAVAQVAKLHPDIVLMDVAMPEMNGLQATRKIAGQYPDMRILILTQHDNHEFITPILQAGASGYILKKSGGRELVNAIREVHEQGVFLEATITRQLLDDYARPVRKTSLPDIHLTQREKEVLQQLTACLDRTRTDFRRSVRRGRPITLPNLCRLFQRRWSRLGATVRDDSPAAHASGREHGCLMVKVIYAAEA